MASNTQMNDLVSRFNALQAREMPEQRYYKDLVERLHALQETNHVLQEKLADANLGLNHMSQLRKLYEGTRLQCETLTADLRNIRSANNYVFIIMDGNGLIFDNRFIKQGREGGKQAAQALLLAVAKLCPSLPSSFEIFCDVLVNIAEMGRALVNDGSIDEPSLFHEFAIGFTEVKSSFNFIDIGLSKGTLVRKIQGIGHGAQYAPFLRRLNEAGDARMCVSVILGEPIVREIEACGNTVYALDGDVFRTTKLVDKTLIEKPSVQRTEATKPQGSPVPRAATTQAVLTPTTSTSSMSPPQTSWAKITKSATPPPKLTMPLPPKQDKTKLATKAPPQPAWSPGPRGRDPPITVGLPAMEDIKRREDSDKLCNNHFLRGPCTRIGACTFNHTFKPSKEQLKALAMLARQNPCINGQDCDVDDCIYGHNCPNVTNGVCTRSHCRFKVDGHPPNTKFTNSFVTQWDN
ncbi:hypothetical protein FANTH_5707 [Fusarium anthophilum]|uniref:C3H1-type domain-containing protein n=1 Tax=Fusarium anthophilum TaxID=48485 RepID=A0A8H4ZLR8_9HYPO|nr:hypothetical protein FANTH_5707 [Fusarium anthophilum]